MANKLQRTYKLDDTIEHVIYEKNVRTKPSDLVATADSLKSDIGGTWFENKYPGVRFPRASTARVGC
jgi:hypothetical protein